MATQSILLVDDDPLVLRLFGRTLGEAGYQTTLVNGGAEAFLALDRKSYDLVVTDLIMDPIDGLAVLRKAKERSADATVIIVTGHADLESAIDALRLHADDYILKPCEPDELQFRVTRTLEKAQQRRRLRVYEDLLPVCCVCGAIRDDGGHAPGSGPWMPLEKFIEQRSGCEVTSAYCPSCAEDIRDKIEHES
ncbi:MAG: response regulator [Pseudomonadota bacterium]